ncbi:phosphate regulon transcriptional regulatory protein PhoB [compost metagenome]
MQKCIFPLYRRGSFRSPWPSPRTRLGSVAPRFGAVLSRSTRRCVTVAGGLTLLPRLMHIALLGPRAYPAALLDDRLIWRVFPHSPSLVAAMHHHAFALVCIDGALPTAAAVAALGALRCATDAPLLMLGGAHDEDKLLATLAAGADDWLDTHASPRLLAARMRVWVRRFSPAMPTAALHLGRYTLHPAERLVTMEGQPLTLRPLEFDLARLLFAQAGHDVSIPRIEQVVWRRALPPQSRALAALVSRLRDALRLEEHRDITIRAVRNRGYRLECRTAMATDPWPLAAEQGTSPVALAA